MRHTPLIAFVVVALLPSAALPQSTCENVVNGMVSQELNTPQGEDVDLLASIGGAGNPSITFVSDTSQWMRRLPVDVTDPTVLAAGLQCSNTLLNGIQYDADPCWDVDANSQLGGCDESPWVGLTYQPGHNYQQWGHGNKTLPNQVFNNNQYYIHDYFWAPNIQGIAPGGPFPTCNNGGQFNNPTDACLCAGVPLAEVPACIACISGGSNAGYYLPLGMVGGDALASADGGVNPRPVFNGNWLTFNTPKYILGRQMMVWLFSMFQGDNHSMTFMSSGAGDSSDNTRGCYSHNFGGVAPDPNPDSLFNVSPGNSCKFRGGSCGGGGSTQPCYNHIGSFGSDVFMGPQPVGTTATAGGLTVCGAGFINTGADLPSDAPPTAAGAVLLQGADGVCRGWFVNAAGVAAGVAGLTTAHIVQPAICADYGEDLFYAGETLANPTSVFGNYFNASYGPGTWSYDGNNVGSQGICGAACAPAAVIMLAGGHPSYDDNLPCNVLGDAGCTSVVSAGNFCGASGPPASTNVQKVANFLANNDFGSGNVPIRTFIVGIGTQDSSLFGATVQGKGAFLQVQTANQMVAAIREAVNLASQGQFSFSNAAVSSVQSKTSTGLLVPRFTPTANRAFWPGHLFQFGLFSEDACGCTGAVGDPCDFNHDGVCGEIFFRDASGCGTSVPSLTCGQWIAADNNGLFWEVPTAGAVPPPDGGGTPAVPFWDGQATIADAGWTNRHIFTVIDDNGSMSVDGGDGIFDYRDTVISFDSSNVNLIAPYMAIGTGLDVCTQIGTRLSTCLSPAGCATIIINYVRGADVFDENCNGSTTDTRPSVLGDVFHSSPVVIDPPTSTSNPICSLGLENQCLVSLTGTPTTGGAAAYGTYQTNYQHRDKVVLVGANDGLLHAFHAGTWHACNACANVGDQTCGTPPGTCVSSVGYYDLGTGAEAWAFIPPDLLPKLGEMLLQQHQYYVDGSAMVRDVWADANHDYTKQANEFHTVAVMGERRGGNEFFAMDVTSPWGPDAGTQGFFRWEWPQPISPCPSDLTSVGCGQFAAGASFDDFLPTPPPIGPVRIASTGSPLTTVDGGNYEERWIVLLNGGYDATLQRGANINMVDVWYGGQGVFPAITPAISADPVLIHTLPIWQFNPGQNEGFPFAATPAMSAFGVNTQNLNASSNQDFFDTAIIGDLGGQVWALRFNNPDPNVWSGGRAFTVGGDGTPGDTPTQQLNNGAMCNRAPIFQIAANTISSTNGNLFTSVGTGDRVNLTDNAGGDCSMTNLEACAQRGCQVQGHLHQHVGAADYEEQFQINGSCQWQYNFNGHNSMAGACVAGQRFDPMYDLQITCPGGVNIHPQMDAQCTWGPTTTCGVAGSGPVSCKQSPISPINATVDIQDAFPNYNGSITQGQGGNGFYSFKVFDGTTGGGCESRAIFDHAPNVANSSIYNCYDDAALNPSMTPANGFAGGMVEVNPYTATPTAGAGPINTGWFVNYDDAFIPAHPSVANFNWINERTLSPAIVANGCAFWNTFTPSDPTTGTCGPSIAGQSGSYSLNYQSGGLCASLVSTDGGTMLPYNTVASIVPPSPPTPVVQVTPAGIVKIDVVGIPREAGGSAGVITAGTNAELIKRAASVDVGRQLHGCRHQDPTLPQGPPTTPGTQDYNAAQVCAVR